MATAARFCEPDPFPDDDDALPRLDCPNCGPGQEWRLVEYGFTAYHHAQSIENGTLYATGAGYGDFTDDGEGYRINCENCREDLDLPEGLEIEWE